MKKCKQWQAAIAMYNRKEYKGFCEYCLYVNDKGNFIAHITGNFKDYGCPAEKKKHN